MAIEDTHISVVPSPTSDSNRNFCIVRMIPSKLSCFFYLAMVGTYAHYSNIFLRDVGLTLPECGFISGIDLIALGISSPLWGLLTDYTGRRKLIYFILSIAMICCLFPLPFVAAMVNPVYVMNGTTGGGNGSSLRNTTSTQQHKAFSSPIFFSMLTMLVASKIFVSPLHSMIDAAVMNVIEMKEPRATYGEQRLYGGLGYGFGSFVTGVIIDHFGNSFMSKGLSKYTSMFCIFLPIALITLPISLYLLNQMDISIEERDDDTKSNKMKVVLRTFSDMKNIMFLLSVFITGFASMTLAAYLFILMKDRMHSSKSLMGSAILTQSLIQIFIFPFADKIIHLVGGPIISIEIAIFSYCVRFIANSFIINPWLIILTQTLHSVGFSLFWAAAMVHTQQIAPKEIYVTMYTIVSGTYLGVGGIVANMLGGVIYSKYDGDILFRAMGVLCGIWTIVMMLYFHSSSFLALLGWKRKDIKVYPTEVGGEGS